MNNQTNQEILDLARDLSSAEISDALDYFRLPGSALSIGCVAGPMRVVGFAFTLFEILVAFLQAYIFTILTGVYIQLALAEEH